MRGRRGRAGRWAGRTLAATVVVALAGGGASGQSIENLALARAYGTGVHAYFSGAYDRTYDDMTSVIEAGSEDPRALYFRGLAALKMGRLDEAEADFSSGADLEARANGAWRVAPSLERVQGGERLQLERHRVRARVAALQQDRARERKRYSGIADSQPEVLRRMRPDERAEQDSGTFSGRPRTQTPPAERPVAPAPEPEPIPEPVTPAVPGDEPAAPGEVLEAEPEPGPAAPADEPVDRGAAPAEVMEEPPATPVEAPSEPELPAEPAAPAEPEAPAEPATPVEPDEPVAPSAPAEPGEPAEPVIPAEPAAPAEPLVPAEPAEPVEPPAAEGEAAGVAEPPAAEGGDPPAPAAGQ